MESVVESERSSPRFSLALFALSWLAAVALIAASGALRALPAQVIPLWVLATNALMVIAHRRRGAFRAAVDAMDARAVFGFQALRAPIGAAFVYFGSRGVLPERWAAHAGWGDLAVGVFALVIVFAGATGARWRGTRLVFTVLGLADIVSVVIHAQIVAVVQHDARFVSVATALPFAVIPFFVVPLVFATHALSFRRDLALRSQQ